MTERKKCITCGTSWGGSKGQLCIPHWDGCPTYELEVLRKEAEELRRKNKALTYALEKLATMERG